MLVVLGVVAVLFLIVAGCLFGAQLYGGGRVYGAEEQFNVARAASYHMAVGWGLLFAIMLAMGAASRPLEDGRAQFLLTKPVRRSHVLLGQLVGVFLSALAAAAALAALASALSLIRAHVFPWTLWLGLAVASLALALVVALVAFFSLFLPRVVAAMLGIIFYLASFPAAFGAVRDFMTGGYRDAGWPEDYDLVLRLLSGGHRLSNLPLVLLHWRDRPERLSRTDARYSQDAFRNCKLHYLAPLLERFDGVVVWGAGPVGKAFARALLARGVTLRAFVDLDPRKIGQITYGAPVIHPDRVNDYRGAFVLAAVAGEVARAEIRAALAAAGWREEQEYVVVA